MNGTDLKRMPHKHKPDTSKARYDLKVVLLHLWRVNVGRVGGFACMMGRALAALGGGGGGGAGG